MSVKWGSGRDYIASPRECLLALIGGALFLLIGWVVVVGVTG